MPFLTALGPTIGGAVVGGAAQLASGLIGSRGQSKAAEAQTEATSEAIAFQREQAEKAEAFNQQMWDDYLRRRDVLLQRFGVELPPPAQAPAGAAGGPVPGPAGMAGPGRPTRGAGLTMGELAARRGGPRGDVFDWRTHGLRR
jgi:hypothetical protein